MQHVVRQAPANSGKRLKCAIACFGPGGVVSVTDGPAAAPCPTFGFQSEKPLRSNDPERP
ncbi:hypothetical protein CBM2609_A70432 [Cupriavidus taiwanensis]|nr:hypothetical protein CBM2604_A60430 [Cupriavidus taiwanensis]SOZ29139.1 hypothetical protein CBM2609_A70432 [Cupriavidus taiwanensis]